jgi:hypothetical protein
LALLGLTPTGSVIADLRLDDHETQWPDHVGVQNEAAGRLNAELTEAAGVSGEATIRRDRSTVLLSSPIDTQTSDLDEILERVVEEDVGIQLAGSETPDAVADKLEALDADLSEAESAQDPAALALASEVLDVRMELYAASIATQTTRSRFVVLDRAETQAEQPHWSQWLAGVALVVGGATVLAFERQRA